MKIPEISCCKTVNYRASNQRWNVWRRFAKSGREVCGNWRLGVLETVGTTGQIFGGMRGGGCIINYSVFLKTQISTQLRQRCNQGVIRDVWNTNYLADMKQLSIGNEMCDADFGNWSSSKRKLEVERFRNRLGRADRGDRVSEMFSGKFFSPKPSPPLRKRWNLGTL